MGTVCTRVWYLMYRTYDGGSRLFDFFLSFLTFYFSLDLFITVARVRLGFGLD